MNNKPDNENMEVVYQVSMKMLKETYDQMMKYNPDKETKSTDQLLDEYNDNMRLYHMFQDVEYLNKAEAAMTQMKAEV